MSPPTAIIDTNVVVSGIITTNGSSPTAQIVDAMLAGSFPFVLSIELLAEYRAVLLRPKLRKVHGLDEAAVDVVLTRIAANAMVREGVALSAEGPDPDDRFLWALVAAVPGGVLVTGDRPLLHRPPGGASVLSPAAFAEMLAE